VRNAGNGVDMAMNIQEIYDLMDGLPIGAWVAISTEQRRVLSYGDDAMKVFAEAKAAGEKIPFIGRVLDPELSLAPSAWITDDL